MTDNLQLGGDTSLVSAALQSERRTDEVSLVELYHVLRRRWKIVLALPCFCLLLVTIFVLARGPRFTVSTSFLPQGTGTTSTAAGLAARLGVALPQAEPGQSAQFYADFVKSNEVLRELVGATYVVDSGGPATDLIELLDAAGGNRDQRLFDATRRLRDAIQVTLREETGLVRVEVTTRWPRVSFEVATELLQVLNRFNLDRRQSTASAEREFAQEQVAEAGAALRLAEDSLQSFLQRNRQFQNSPELTFQHDRLVRTVNMRQAISTALAQALNNAQLEEVRNTPLITTVEPPHEPAQADRRFLLAKGLVSLLIGSVISVVLVLSMDAVGQQSGDRQVASLEA